MSDVKGIEPDSTQDAKIEGSTEPGTEGTTEENVRQSVVTMDNGISVDFGKRDNVRSSFIEKEGTAVFSVRDGKTINWDLPYLEKVEGISRKILMYGMLQRVKNSLAGKTLEELAKTIETQIKAINDGVFDIKGTNNAGTAKLSISQKAFAIARSAIPAKKVKHWARFDDPIVIAEVLSFWATLSTKQKLSISMNTNVKLQKALLQVKLQTEEPQKEELL